MRKERLEREGIRLVGTYRRDVVLHHQPRCPLCHDPPRSTASACRAPGVGREQRSTPMMREREECWERDP